MKNKKFLICLIAFFVTPVFLYAQDSLFSFLPENVEIHGFIESYYNYNTDKSNEPKFFPSVSPYRNQFRVNIAQLSIKYNSDIFRGNLTFQYGDIPDVNWEPATKYKYIQEANLGYSPFKKFWIDAGFFQTHLGAEGFPPNNFLNSNALISVAEPNFQSELKFSYEFTKKFNASFHLMNGSNLYEDNNKNKSFGFQLNYILMDNLQITYNNIMGNEFPAEEKNPRTSFLHNFIVSYSPTGKIDLLGNFDIGHREKSRLLDTALTAYVCGGLISARYKFNKKFNTSFRCEYYQDLDGILSGIVYGSSGAKGNGFAIGGDYKPIENVYLRLEYYFLRMDSKQKVFSGNDNIRHEINLSVGFGY